MATNNGDINITISENHTGVSQQYVDGKVAQEATARQDADTAVTAAMTALVEAEAGTRATAVSEETNRATTAEEALSIRITANADAISAVDGMVAAEAATRTSEDARIEAIVTANRQTTEATFASVNATIAANEAECVSRVEAEASARQAGEATMRAYVDSKTAGALHYRGTVATAADLPQSRQAEGDMYNVEADGQNYAWNGSQWDSQGPLINLRPLEAGIQNNATAIANEATARQSGDATLQSNIEAEATARQAADATLQNNITAENTRATSAEGALNTAITTEASNRQAADATLRAELEAEISRKTSAQIAADFEQVKAKLNAVSDITDTSGFWVFAVTDADGNVTFGQTINGEIINALAL